MSMAVCGPTTPKRWSGVLFPSSGLISKMQGRPERAQAHRELYRLARALAMVEVYRIGQLVGMNAEAVAKAIVKAEENRKAKHGPDAGWPFSTDLAEIAERTVRDLGLRLGMEAVPEASEGN